MAYNKIGEAARLAGLSIKAIRYYERIGLIPPAKRRETVYSGNGFRLYEEADVKRLQFINRAKLLDLSLKEIRELLGAVENGCCASARPSLQELVERKAREIDERIAILKRLKTELRSLGQALQQGEQESCDCPATEDVLVCLLDESPAKGGER